MERIQRHFAVCLLTGAVAIFPIAGTILRLRLRNGVRSSMFGVGESWVAYSRIPARSSRNK